MRIKIPSVIDAEIIERLILDLVQYPDRIDVEFPLNISSKGFSVLPSLCQFFFTWRRSSSFAKLIITNSENFDQDFYSENRSISHYLFLVSIIAWDTEIIDQKGNDLKAIIRMLNRSIMDRFRKNEINILENSVVLPFVDNLPGEIGLLPILYNNGSLRGEDDFEIVSDILISLSTNKYSFLADYLNKIKPGLNKILFEAFDNTNNWAVQSFTGKILNPSLRAIYAKFHEGNIREMSSFENSVSLSRYFSELRLKKPLGHAYRSSFLEISIFDSGSGLVQVFSGRPIESLTLTEEYNYLIECLQKHKTSHTAINVSYGRGAGLYRIMTTLSEVKAYLLIRTGRLLLYRDFLNLEFHNKTYKTYNYSLLDLNNHSSIPTERPFAEGTLISIIIPQLFQA